MSTEKDINATLIRWLEGDLTAQELAAFEASTEFKEYNKIVEATDSIAYPTMDEDAVFSSIQDKIASKKSVPTKTKVISLKQWVLAVASIAVLAFAVVTLMPGSVNVTSNIGQQFSHTLPDGSDIELNGKSKISYESDFDNDRIIKLDGEAFFSVKKGKSFEVKTKDGIVSVLGTSFNVYSRNNTLSVACKTGKVRVVSGDQSVILQKGERISIENKTSSGKETIEEERIGSWIQGESYFSKAKLDQVVMSLSSAYDVQIDLPAKYKNKRFTGSFVYGDIEKALKMVFSPMGISYSIEEGGKILITNK